MCQTSDSNNFFSHTHSKKIAQKKRAGRIFIARVNYIKLRHMRYFFGDPFNHKTHFSKKKKREEPIETISLKAKEK